MSKIIKLKKGLDLRLVGEAEKVLDKLPMSENYAVCPTDFEGVTPKLLVKVGDKVIASKYAGTDVKVDGEEFTIVRQSDILAIVE